MSNIVVNPKVKDYLAMKGKINTMAVFNALGVVPHEGQRKLINAYESKIAPSEETLERGKAIGVNFDFEYEYDTLIAAAGRRGGKSYSISGIGTGELLIPYSHVLLASYTLENCEIIFKQIREFIRKLDIEITVDRQKEKYLELLNGARLTVGSVENIESKLGNYVTLLILDEAKKFQKNLYEQVLVPMLADVSPYGRSVLISSPEEGWFETYYNYGQSKDPAFSKYWSINFPTAANPAIPRAWIENARRTLPPDVFEQEIMGKFTAGAGKVFPEFSRENNVRPLSYYPLLEHWVRHNIVINTIDSGFSHYFSSYHFVYVEEIDTFIIFTEYNQNKTTTPIHAQNIKNTEEAFVDREPDIRFADPAAAQTIADLADHGLHYNSSEKNLRETVQFINSLCYQRSEVTGESRFIVIDERCPELIRQLTEVKWKEDHIAKVTRESGNAKGTKPFAPDLNKRTDWDAIDAIRYGVYSYGKNIRISVNIFDSVADQNHDVNKDELAMYLAGYVKM